MKVGLINNSHCIVYDGKCSESIDLVSFIISPECLSFTEIFDSAFASPARYLMEIFRRLHATENGISDGVFIFNPLFELPYHQVGKILNLLIDLTFLEEPLVVSDEQNKPIGYFLPAWVELSEEWFLSLMSAVNARLDQNLLNSILGGNSRNPIIDMTILKHVGNGFPFNEDLWCVYEILAKQALSLINKVCIRETHVFPHRQYELTPSVIREMRSALKFYSVMPHHAGDVLFYSIAAQNTPNSKIKGIVVNKIYEPILKEVLADYAAISLDLVPPYRDGTGVLQSDENYFFEINNEMLPFSFYQFFRPSRDYNATNLHLIDHFAFALGQSFLSVEDLVTRTKRVPDLYRLEGGGPYRILLHFDAGWGLKVYPKDSQLELISMLLNCGMEITVLGTEARDFGKYKSVKFKGLESLKNLLTSHHLLVGSDSFPSHYAAHVVGLPTICLFGPTKPVNSDALPSKYYKALECGMSCKPCGQLEKCLLTDSNDCGNMVHPDRIHKEILIMLNYLSQEK